jgi:hypothetical protein
MVMHIVLNDFIALKYDGFTNELLLMKWVLTAIVSIFYWGLLKRLLGSLHSKLLIETKALKYSKFSTCKVVKKTRLMPFTKSEKIMKKYYEGAKHDQHKIK